MIEDRLKICCSVNSECEVIFDRTLRMKFINTRDKITGGQNGRNVMKEEELVLRARNYFNRSKAGFTHNPIIIVVGARPCGR